MATFVLNEGLGDERKIEAKAFKEDGSFVVFTGNGGTQIFAYPTTRVFSIAAE